MSNPVLSVATYYKNVPMFDVATTDSLLNAQAAIISAADPNSILLGGDSAQDAVADVFNMAKKEVLHVLPVGDNGKNAYYSTNPSYKVKTATDIIIVTHPDQVVTVASTATATLGTVTATFIVQPVSGTFYVHKVLKLAPGHSGSNRK
jgi:hypothetical protein